jgi:hypothetical protein
MHCRITSLCTSYQHDVYLFLMTVLLATNLLSLFLRDEPLLLAPPA